MDVETRQRFAGLWADRLGCDPALLSTPGVHVVAARRQRGGLFLLAYDHSLVIAGDAPPARSLGRRLEGDPRLPSPDRIRGVLGESVARIDGPTVVSMRAGAPDLPAGTAALRLLGAADRPALRRLRDAASPDEWERAGLGREPASAPIAGVFDAGRLVAAASFDEILGRAAHLRVFTDRSARGRGAARRAVAAVAYAAAARGLLLQYDALASDPASLRVAASLGFVAAATCLTVSLRKEVCGSDWHANGA